MHHFLYKITHTCCLRQQMGELFYDIMECSTTLLWNLCFSFPSGCSSEEFVWRSWTVTGSWFKSTSVGKWATLSPPRCDCGVQRGEAGNDGKSPQSCQRLHEAVLETVNVEHVYKVHHLSLACERANIRSFVRAAHSPSATATVSVWINVFMYLCFQLSTSPHTVSLTAFVNANCILFDVSCWCLIDRSMIDVKERRRKTWS